MIEFEYMKKIEDGDDEVYGLCLIYGSVAVGIVAEGHGNFARREHFFLIVDHDLDLSRIHNVKFDMGMKMKRGMWGTHPPALHGVVHLSL